MSYYVDENQLRDNVFETTLDFYNDENTKANIIDLKIDPEIKEIYDINIRAAKGYLSYLNDLESSLKSSKEKAETFEKNIEESTESVKEKNEKYIEAILSLRKARKERFEESIGSKEEKAANEKVKQAKESTKQAKTDKYKAKETLEKYKKEYKDYLIKLLDSEGKKKKIEDVVASCKSQNKRIVAETNEQIKFVTEFKTKVDLLAGKIKNDEKIRYGAQLFSAQHLLGLLKQFSDNLTVSLAKPLTNDSIEVTLLHSLEEQALKDDRKQEYSEKFSQKRTKISNEYEKHKKINKAYTKYIFQEPDGR